MALSYSEPSESLPSFQSISESISTNHSDFNSLSPAYSVKSLIKTAITPGFGEGSYGPVNDIGGAIEEEAAEITQGDTNCSLDPAPHIRDQAGTLECGLEPDEEHTIQLRVDDSKCDSNTRQQTVNSTENLSHEVYQNDISIASPSINSQFETSSTTEARSQRLCSPDSAPSPITPPMPSKQITIRYFYPIDPITLTQQQDPVYNDPQCPIVKPIHVWPPPELVEWRKGKRKQSNFDHETGNVARKKRRMDESSGDEEFVVNSVRSTKRVRWKSVDDVSFFESIKLLTVDPRKKPVVSLPMKGSVNPTLYRAMSIPSLSPSPSEDEDEDSYLDRRARRRSTPMLATRPEGGEGRKPFRRISSPLSLVSTATSSVPRSMERCCHQCRRSHTVPPAPKMICSSTRPNGETCVFRYCITCVNNRYEEPFEPSAMTWTCFFCRGICNCSICLRKEGFGYIFDGPLAEELKQRRRSPPSKKRKANERSKLAKSSTNVNAAKLKLDSSRTLDNRPSISKWLARRGVVTGTAAWMAERRREGVRFVIGRSPSPGIDSSIPAEECQFIQQSEKLESRTVEPGKSSDMPISAQVLPTELTGPSSRPVESADWDTPQSANPYDVFPALNFRGKRFFVGKRLNRHVRPAAIKNQSRSNTMKPDCQDAEEDCQTRDHPRAMTILRPPSKPVGFYAEDNEVKEKEDETCPEVVQRAQSHKPESEEKIGTLEPSLSYSTVTSTLTSGSTRDMLCTPTSCGINDLSQPYSLQPLLAAPEAEPWYHTGLNARGLELEGHLVCSKDGNLEAQLEMNEAGSDNPGDSLLFSNVTSPTRILQNTDLQGYRHPFPAQGYGDTLEGIYNAIADPLASSFDSWLVTNGLDGRGNHESDDIDAIGEPDDDATCSVDNGTIRPNDN